MLGFFNIYFKGEHHDDRCALVTRFHALRILFFTGADFQMYRQLGVKPNDTN